VLIVLTGCSHAIGKDPASGGRSDAGADDAGMDAGKFGNANPNLAKKRDGGFPKDAEVTADAFFVNDPEPPMCGQDGKQQAAPPVTGTPECPSDKNREGCPCTKDGMTASCWPGKRLNRSHGICKDGTTTCKSSVEFGLRWGPCVGYTLPQPDAAVGPDACRCFSTGTWKVDNLGPCIVGSGSTGTYLYSGKLLADGSLDCGTNVGTPPAVPDGTWSADTLTIDCAGQFKLCYTIKAGSVSNPKPDDCTVIQKCIDVWYPEAGKEQKLPDLPAWASTDTACAAQFVANHGYGEMSVIGQSIECDAVDDGAGHPYVFHRTDYCPANCKTMPNAPGCQGCQTGGSGMFGP
jgi:hypothetical protein